MKRPRLLVPGLVELVPTYRGDEHRVLRGDLAGYRIGEDVTNWKNSYTFVALEDLSLEERLRYAPRWAAVWKELAGGLRAPRGYRDGEGSRWSRLATLFSHARLLLVASTDGRRLGPAAKIPLEGGHRILDVGFHRNADDYFNLRLCRGKVELAVVSGSIYGILDALEQDPEAEDRDDGWVVDRILRAATGGLADSSQIGLAFWMADVVSADLWEEHLAALEAYGAPLRMLATSLSDALATRGDGPDLAVSPYGPLRRLEMPALELRSAASEDSLDAFVDIQGKPTLELEAETVWFICADDDPLPSPARGLFGASHAIGPVATNPRGARIAIAVLLVVAAVIAIVLLGGRR